MKLLLDDKATRGYDLDARGWRSFRLDNFIGFVTEV